MKDDDFLKLMQEVLSLCNITLGATSGLIFNKTEYVKTALYSYSFHSNMYSLGLSSDCGSWTLYPLAAAINDCLIKRIAELERPGGEFWLDDWPDPNSVDRIARSFCLNAGFLIRDDYRRSYGLDLDNIDSLSARPYEKEGCCGKLLFIPDLETDLSDYISVQIKSIEEITLDNERQIRKLLAGAGNNTLLLQRTDKGYVVKGFCQTIDSTIHGWLIRIQGVQDWLVSYYSSDAETGLVHFKLGNPQVVSNPVDMAFNVLTEEFPNLKDYDTIVKEQINLANQQSHGTALVYLNLKKAEVKDWVERLYTCKRALKVRMTNTQDLATLSAMDGCILINAATAEVAYVATIVDGLSISDGLQDKGARHNGIYTFVSNLADCTKMGTNVVCALVFSEDGGITSFRGSQIATRDIKYHTRPVNKASDNGKCFFPNISKITWKLKRKIFEIWGKNP